MATKFYLRSAVAADLSSDLDRTLTTTVGASQDIIQATTVTGPATVQFASGSLRSWWFEAAAVTVSGTVTFNLWGLESAMTVNAGFQVAIDRCDSTGAFISNIVTSAKGTELPLSTAAVQNWTATPTSTTLADGDYIRVRVYAVDAGGTMAAGTASLFYEDSVANTAESWVQFTESIVAGTPASFLASKPLIIGQAVTRASTR